ncbi:hypothetical protein CALCODRAFT_502154 [Calocera cornea HHB12733]|uniref:Uncharacterized protein n=1 Tax=Calocera cornea HHB12733 TaxID=1353952 RepID=A0A165DCU8_9BASI|nr:hypothetical protein CALCODRAFT_502154 [Calocera cornea HHB12733]
MAIDFIHGEPNVVLVPEGTKPTFAPGSRFNIRDSYGRYTSSEAGRFTIRLGQGSAKYVFQVVLNRLETAELKHGVEYASVRRSWCWTEVINSSIGHGIRVIAHGACRTRSTWTFAIRSLAVQTYAYIHMSMVPRPSQPKATACSFTHSQRQVHGAVWGS